MIALRPVLPLVNYAINYDYIVKNLCENRSKLQSTCNGKCYVVKELSKTERQSDANQTIKLSSLDVFLYNDILTFSDSNIFEIINRTTNSNYSDFYTSEYFLQIFHPPLA
jgi:hypothetical protein